MRPIADPRRSSEDSSHQHIAFAQRSDDLEPLLLEHGYRSSVVGVSSPALDRIASTTPPPCFWMAASAAFRAVRATPRRRYFLGTTKQVILHSILSLADASLRYLGLLSMRGNSSISPYWHQPTGAPCE